MKSRKPERNELLAFARKHVSNIGQITHLEELRGGNLNFVWRLQSATGYSFVIKHAPPYIASVPNLSLDDSRIVFEGRILEAFTSSNELKPLTGFGVRPPELIAADFRNHLLIMEDVGSLPDLTQAISAFNYDLGALAGRLGEFIAQLHAQTYRNDWFAEKFANLPVQKARLQVQYNGCRKFCKNAGRSDADDIGGFCRKLGEKFNSVGKCLIMGDLWPASILVTPGEIRLIDWEFVHFGRPAQDVAHLYSHLWMAAHRHKDKLEKAEIGRLKHKFIKGYLDTIKYLKPDLWTAEDKRDFQIHFGAEIIARTAGIFQKGYLYDGLPPKHPVIHEALEEAKDWILGEKEII